MQKKFFGSGLAARAIARLRLRADILPPGNRARSLGVPRLGGSAMRVIDKMPETA